jgi:hypothetical protein
MTKHGKIKSSIPVLQKKAKNTKSKDETGTKKCAMLGFTLCDSFSRMSNIGKAL